MKIVLLCSEDFSLGITSLSAYLKERGHDARVIFDPKQFEKAYAQSEFWANIFSRKKLILSEILEYKPDLVGISVFTSNYRWALDMAASVKRTMDVPVIFGGVHPSLAPEHVIQEDQVDMVCVGEGEEPLFELLESLKNNQPDTSIKNIWFKRNGNIVKNEIRPLTRDIDALPLPDRKALYSQLPRSYSKYPIVLTSYGCPFRCTYCANNALAAVYKGKGKYIRRRSPDNVMAEIRGLKSEFNPKYIIFMDDLFTFDKAWLKEFAPKYAAEIGLPYSCLVHPKFLDREICELLKMSNCNLALIGLQSGCERIRKEVLNRNESNEECKKACRRLKDSGIKFSLDNILNLPFDNQKTIEESLRFYNELRPDLIHSFSLVYFPKTEIIDLGIKAGLLEPGARDLINKGLSQGYMSAKLHSAGFYRKYALLFTITPLFSYATMKKIIHDPAIRRAIESLPGIFVLLAKFILNVKANTGFIFFTVLKNEFYYMKKTIYQKKRLKREVRLTEPSLQETL